jgi:amino acid transporter
MKERTELFFYLTVAVGMALATSSFTVLSGLYGAVEPLGVAVAIAAAGVFCYVLALSLAELAGMFPSAPGIRTYLKPALGALPSLVIVYLYLAFTVLMGGVEGFMFVAVLRTVWPGIPAAGAVVALMVFITSINLAGLEMPRGTQMALTVACVLLLLAAPALGLARDGGAAMVAAVGRFSPGGLASAIGMAVFLYMGFEWATPVGLGPRSYERLIPRSLPLSILILAGLYLAFTATASAYVPRATLMATWTPQVALFEALVGPRGRWIALGMALGASLSTFNAGIMGGSRLVFMLAREGHLPRWCTRLSDRTGVAWGAILLLGSLSTLSGVVVVTWNLQLTVAVVGAAIMCCVYASFALAVILLRRRRPDARRPYRTPIPLAGQWALVVVLPLLGAGSLTALPAGSAALCLAAVGATALLLALWSSGPGRAPQPAAKRAYNAQP